MDIEQKATSAIKDIISETDYLEAFIREKDKEPCWDGYVCIHSDKNYSKTDIKKVNVQVKGLVVNPRKAKEHIQFSVEHRDLTAFLNDGGAIFFVVYINKYTRKAEQIYYSFLLPEYIKKIITLNREEYSIRFKKFPADTSKIEDLFVSFYEDSKKQASFSNTKTIPPAVFAKKRDFTGFSFSITSGHQLPTVYELPKYLEGKALSIYGHLSSVDVPIPVDYIDEINNIAVSECIEVPIYVGDTKYYDSYLRTYFKDKIILQIGSCITITINEDENGGYSIPFQVDYKVAGTLSERIRGLQFVKAAIISKGFNFGKNRFDFNVDDGLKSFDLKYLTATLDGYIKAEKTLKSLSVEKEPDLDNFTDDDYLSFNKLISSVLDKKSITGTVPIYNKILDMKIGNLNLAVTYLNNSDNSYVIVDVFHTHLGAKIINNDTREEYSVSQFTLMRSPDFLKYDNLNLPFILEDYKLISVDDKLYNDATITALELIKAYDKSQKEAFLDTADEIFDWIEKNDGIQKEILIVDRLQIIRRKRPLKFAEKHLLSDLITDSDNLQIKCCAFLLLDEQKEAKKIIDLFDETTKGEFLQYPICKFYNGENTQV